jgi:ribosomal protein S18 acetylase RimI-like enzyme
MDAQRDKAFIDAVGAGKKKYFDQEFGNQQLHLMVLATHPDYQNRGAGAMHCRWGMSLAKEKDLRVTLFASPMGEGLYTYLGFKTVGHVVIQVDGEEEKIETPAMVYDPLV